MRINTVKKARKDQGTCSGCGKEIKRGDSYTWIKFRYGGKTKKCGSCIFKASDMTSSDKLSRIYAAQENAVEAIEDLDVSDNIEDISSVLEELASEVREVAQEYQESADNIRESFTESSTADECEEKAQVIEDWADECEDPGFEEFEFDESDECKNRKDDGLTKAELKEAVDTARAEALNEWFICQQSMAVEVAGNCPV